MFIPAAFAQSLLPGNVSTDCIQKGTCALQDFVLLAISIANWILGIAGVLALLFFVWAGIQLIWPSEEMRKKGKSAFLNAAFGLIIVLIAYVGVRFVVSDLLGIPLQSGLMINVQQAVQATPTPQAATGACFYLGPTGFADPRCAQTTSDACPPSGYTLTNFTPGGTCPAGSHP